MSVVNIGRNYTYYPSETSDGKLIVHIVVNDVPKALWDRLYNEEGWIDEILTPDIEFEDYE